MDDLFRELVEVDHDKALRFFVVGLQEVTNRPLNREMVYVASVLGHYAQTSRYDMGSMPSLANLGEVFDNFVIRSIADPEILEIGGSQIILFAGFFRDQMKGRHNVKWYDEVGQSFYSRASDLSRDQQRRKLFEDLAESLPYWTVRCQALSRKLSENRFLLKFS